MPRLWVLAILPAIVWSCAHASAPTPAPSLEPVETARVVVNGRAVELATPPRSDGSRVLVPLAEVVSHAGGTLNGNAVNIDGREVTFDRANGRTIGGVFFAPVEELAPLLGRRAGWDRLHKILYVVPAAPLPLPDLSGPPVPVARKSYGPFDKAGIPTKDYGGTLGVQYNPLVVAEFGESHFHRYLSSGDEKERTALLRMAEWLVANLEPMPGRPDAAVWYYKFDWLPYNRKPWISGLTQAHGIEVLIDAWIVSGDTRYLDAASRAFAVLSVPMEQGGVLVRDKGGRLFIEENPGVPPSRIFPGFASLLISLYRYDDILRVPAAAALFREGTATLREMLPLYDAPFALNSVYDLYAPQTFNFMTGTSGAKLTHPISQIVVTPPSDAPYTVEVGSDSAVTAAANRIIPHPETDWSDVITEDGVSYRTYGPHGATYKHAVVTLALSGNFLEGRAHEIAVRYRDDNEEEVFFGVYSRKLGGYVHLGSLEHKGDRQWKWLRVKVYPETLRERFFGHLAHEAYHVSHGGYMRGLYELTGDDRFRVYAERWQSYPALRKQVEQMFAEAEAAAKSDPAGAREKVRAALAIWPDHEPSEKLYADLRYRVNWAKGARAVPVTTFFPPPSAPDAAIDGNESSYAAADVAGKSSFIVDLGAPRTIGRVTLSWFDERNYPTDFAVEANVGGQWVLLAAEKEWKPNEGLRYVRPLPSDVVTQQVRVTVNATTGMNRLLLRELLLEGY